MIRLLFTASLIGQSGSLAGGTGYCIALAVYFNLQKGNLLQGNPTIYLIKNYYINSLL